MSTDASGVNGSAACSVAIPDAKKNVPALTREAKELTEKIVAMLPERLPVVEKWEAELTDESRKKLKPAEKKALEAAQVVGTDRLLDGRPEVIRAALHEAGMDQDVFESLHLEATAYRRGAAWAWRSRVSRSMMPK